MYVVVTSEKLMRWDGTWHGWCRDYQVIT